MSGTIAALHIYLAYGHLTKLTGDEAEWVHIWKGFWALFGAYVFAALASRRPTKSPASSHDFASWKTVRLESRQFVKRMEQDDCRYVCRKDTKNCLQQESTLPKVTTLIGPAA
jgi:hypothetical protein